MNKYKFQLKRLENGYYKPIIFIYDDMDNKYKDTKFSNINYASISIAYNEIEEYFYRQARERGILNVLGIEEII